MPNSKPTPNTSKRLDFVATPEIREAAARWFCERAGWQPNEWNRFTEEADAVLAAIGSGLVAEGVALAADAIKALPPNVDKMIRDYEGDGDFVWTDVEVGILVNWIKSLDDVVLALIDAREGEADG